VTAVREIPFTVRRGTRLVDAACAAAAKGALWMASNPFLLDVGKRSPRSRR
jgi:hypothetical protein